MAALSRYSWPALVRQALVRRIEPPQLPINQPDTGQSVL